jgi:Ca2+-binding EF-hand superfamily protein
MVFFPRRFPKKISTPSSKKIPAKPSGSSIFRRYGGRITLGQFNEMISRIPMRDIEREYTKRVMERFHHPQSHHLTEKEFKQGMNKMLLNTRDPIQRQLIERIKRNFRV